MGESIEGVGKAVRDGAEVMDTAVGVESSEKEEAGLAEATEGVRNEERVGNTDTEACWEEDTEKLVLAEPDGEAA